MRASPLPGRFDLEHLKGIHKHLFKDVYFTEGEHVPAFAGAVRIIGIKKESDVGIDYPHPTAGLDSLGNRLDYAFSELKKDAYLKGMECEPILFAKKLAKHSAEIWECHPFRDGNSRTTFLFTEHLSREAGFPFSRELETNKEFEAVSEFRVSIADYVRGKKSRFVDNIASYIAPERELAIIHSTTDQVKETPAAYEIRVYSD